MISSSLRFRQLGNVGFFLSTIFTNLTFARHVSKIIPLTTPLTLLTNAQLTIQDYKRNNASPHNNRHTLPPPINRPNPPPRIRCLPQPRRRLRPEYPHSPQGGIPPHRLRAVLWQRKGSRRSISAIRPETR